MTLTDDRPSRSATAVTVRPLSGHTGAEIRGWTFPRRWGRSPRVITEALHRWKVVFFRDQAIGHGEQIVFARQFGELTYAHPYDDGPPDGHPEIYTVDPALRGAVRLRG